MATKGFFDLPLEIRQQIYEDVLPEDRQITWDSMVAYGDETWQQLCEAHPRLQVEMKAWIKKQPLSIRVMIRPETEFSTFNFALEEVPVIRVVVCHYTKRGGTQDLEALHSRVTQFVTVLCRHQRLKAIVIDFEEVIPNPDGWDSHWCSRDTDENRVRRPRRGLIRQPESGLFLKYDFPVAGGLSIKEYLLRPFLHAPVFEKATVYPLRAHLRRGRWGILDKPRGDLGEHYFCIAIAVWLMGERGKPFDKCWIELNHEPWRRLCHDRPM